MNDFRRKIVVYLFVMPMLLYVPCCANYVSSYEHEVVSGDTGRRIPLWYPYEVVEDYGRVFVSMWDGGGSGDGGLCAIKNVKGFLRTSNLFCGEQILDGWENSAEKRYFIFSADKIQGCYYSTEIEFLTACSQYGVKGRELRSFEENFQRFVEGGPFPSPWAALVHQFRHGMPFVGIACCAVLVLSCWCLERSQIGRLPVL